MMTDLKWLAMMRMHKQRSFLLPRKKKKKEIGQPGFLFQ